MINNRVPTFTGEGPCPVPPYLSHAPKAFRALSARARISTRSRMPLQIIAPMNRSVGQRVYAKRTRSQAEASGVKHQARQDKPHTPD
ncbi:hypothetical protein QF037_000032 [Streptomyces canus]|nr:hypothetical protein [Streptomyces canus]